MPAARAATLATVLAAAAVGAAGGDWQWSVEAPFEGKTPSVHLWLPESARPAKGLFVFSFYGSFGGYSADPELRALAAELGCGVVGSEERLGVPHDDPKRILDALKALAAKSAHPEVANAPMFIFGHSNSTHDMAQFGKTIADRVIAWVAMKSAFGEQFSVPELYRVPGLVVSGEADDSYFQDQLATVKRLRREHGALMHIIIEADGPHWPVRETFRITQAFLKTAFYLRVPADSDATLGPVKLVALEESSGWLGQNLDGERVRGADLKWSWAKPVDVKQLLEIAPFADYPGEKGAASWLPTGDYARKWQEFCHTAAIRDWAGLPLGFVEGWRTRRGPSAIEGLESDLLADEVRQLAAASSYKTVIAKLHAVAGDASSPARAAEAARIVAHMEKLGEERLAQARRLEETHPPTAAAAYALVERKFAGMKAADDARERLKSAELKERLKLWGALDAMHKAESELRDVRGSKRSAADAKFARTNARALQAMYAAAVAMLRKYPGTPAADEARALLGKYEFPVPKGL